MAKRKAKTGLNKRKTAIRESYDRVLILTEGKKTEQIYFKGLISFLKLSSVNIEILDIKQTTPDSLFSKAQILYKKSEEEKNPYDRVYCVFDKDRHTKYQETKNLIDSIKRPKNVYYYSFSEPCFEFWLLLHYVKTDRPFVNFDEFKKNKDFRKHFPDYEKSKITFTTFEDKILTACENAQNNQHTNINNLIKYLQNIKNK
jgi:hypothetical protein